jgi:hypothetical protein
MGSSEDSTDICRELNPPTTLASDTRLDEKLRDLVSVSSDLVPDGSLESPPLAPEETVRLVLSRLLGKHQRLRMPSRSVINGFLGTVKKFPHMPAWLWYGVLNFAVYPDTTSSCSRAGRKINVSEVNEEEDSGAEEEKEVGVGINFKILDEFLNSYNEDSEIPVRFQEMLFYYMYLHVEGGELRRHLAAMDAERGLNPPKEGYLKILKHADAEQEISEQITPPPQLVPLCSIEESELQDIGVYGSKWNFYKSAFFVLVVSIFILFPHQ